MGIHKADGIITMGPCPGCESWQVDYSHELAEQLPVTSRATDNGAGPVHDPLFEMVEDALAEHLEECPHLREVLDELL